MNSANSIAAISKFEVIDGNAEEFLQLLREHARKALHEDSGCQRFGIFRQSDASFFSNELYDSDAAFKNHEASARSAAFNAAVKPLLKSHERMTGESVEHFEREHGIHPSDLNATNDD